ncbi:hypothetical protein CK203_109212 [Vitis vinifera]|uniref:Retrotransposon gag domain-containing protein n=1 Tax=Vitis vinifera TaxID=29760 RepID=A0A438BLV8_VITVI|nr:hypothetical protein CK203_109212 [Vitis vinifera]
MTVTPLEWVLGRDRVDTMPPRRPTSSQNSQANDDVPPVEGLPLVSAEGIYRGSSLMTSRNWVLLTFSGATDPTEAEAWILKMEKFFGVIDCSEEQKASYAAFMLDKEADHWWRMTRRLLEDQGPITWRQFWRLSIRSISLTVLAVEGGRIYSFGTGGYDCGSV